MKLNWDKLKSFNQQKCKTSLLIERNNLFFIRPEWNESFPIQKSGVSELNVIIMTDLGESVEPKSIASTFLGVEELRSKGHEQDNHAIPLSQEMNQPRNTRIQYHRKCGDNIFLANSQSPLNICSILFFCLSMLTIKVSNAGTSGFK